MRFLISTLTNAFALWVATFLLSGMHAISGSADAGVFTQILIYVVAGAILALVNMLVRPVVKLLSLPLYILTLGLFFIVVNALMILLTSWVSGLINIGVIADGFWWAVAGGIVVGIVNWIIGSFVAKD